MTGIEALYIARFQPLHNGHAHCLKHVLSRETKLYIMVGSSDKSGTDDNPFTTEERLEMVESFLQWNGLSGRCVVRPVPDFNGDDDRWFTEVMRTFPGVRRLYSNNPRTRKIFLGKGLEVFSIPFLDRERLSGSYIRSKGVDDMVSLVPESSERFVRKLG
jgi:nicotinamide-nucleotide adenylyltransferase